MAASYDTINDLTSYLEVQVDQTDALIDDLEAAWVSYDDGGATGTLEQPGDSDDHLDMSEAVGLDRVTGYSADAGSMIVNSATSVTPPGNSWAAVPFANSYDVTANTIVDMDVLAETDPAGIVGFALFDADNDTPESFDVMKSQGFKVMGSQSNSGDTSGSWHVGVAGLGSLQKLEGVPVGSVLTPGTYTHLFLARDHDNSPQGQVTYSNVQQRENAGGPVDPPQDPVDPLQDSVDLPDGAGWGGRATYGSAQGEAYAYFQSPKKDETTMPSDVSLGNGDTWVAAMQFHRLDNGASVMTQIISPNGSFAPDQVIVPTAERDGHYWPSVIKTAAGSLLMVTPGHTNRAFLKASRQPNGDPIGQWTVKDISSEVDADPSSTGFTYATLFQHPGEPGQPIYLISRWRTASHAWGPKMAVSYDDGITWEPVGYIQRSESDRPYWTIASDGVKTHIFMNRDHFGNQNNGLVYGYIQNGRFYDATGTDAGFNFNEGAALTKFADIRNVGTGWTVPWSAAIDSQGRPCIVWTSAKGNPPTNGEHEMYWARVNSDGSVDIEFVRDVRRDSTSVKHAGAAIDPLNPERIAYVHYDGTRQDIYIVERTGTDTWSLPQRLTGMADMSRVQFLRTRHAEPRLIVGGPINPEGQNATDTPGGDPWEDDFGTTGFIIDSTRATPLERFPY